VAAGAPRTRYAIAERNVHIAYQVFGAGPHDLVFLPPFLTNVEVWWDLPIAARFYNRLADFAQECFFQVHVSLYEESAMPNKTISTTNVLVGFGTGRVSRLVCFGTP